MQEKLEKIISGLNFLFWISLRKTALGPRRSKESVLQKLRHWKPSGQSKRIAPFETSNYSEIFLTFLTVLWIEFGAQLMVQTVIFYPVVHETVLVIS